MKEKFQKTEANAGWPLNNEFIINALRKGRRFVRRETLYLLVDYNWSMTGYHGLIDMLIKSIEGSKTFKEVKVYYFHNGPSYSANECLLKRRDIYRAMIPDMNKIRITPSIADFAEDHVYTNRELWRQIPLTQILNALNSDSRVMLISDFGAVKGTFSSVRLLNALTFWKMVKQLTSYAVWFNPCPAQEWEYSTGEQLAKYIPLHVLDFEGFSAIRALFKEVKPNSKPAKIKKTCKANFKSTGNT
jgi:uncharacterized protein with von Willebrand factor type A (vWA) domain